MVGSRDDENKMHRQVSWMTPADVRILELLHSARTPRNQPMEMKPATVAKNTGYSRKHAGNRMRHLADRGLVEDLGGGWYRLDDQGESLMNGGIRPEDLPDD